ncbi:MAG TPA: hypothetical protein VGM76_05060 [Lacipirellulaceae bacterium]|jgi:hypothetical protein
MLLPVPSKVSARLVCPSWAIRSLVAAFVSSSCALGSIATAAPSPSETPRSAADPQSLAADLKAELQLAYRDNVPEITQRSEQLRRALDTWNASPKSAANRDQMNAWLRDSIRLSMPGSDLPLPPAPTFVLDTTKADSASQSALTAKPLAMKSRLVKPVVSREVSQGDPFRDDPAPASAGGASR